MKKKGYRLLALLMAAAMTTLTACSGSDTAGDTSAADSAAVSGETPAEIAEGASISQQQDVVAVVGLHRLAQLALRQGHARLDEGAHQAAAAVTMEPSARKV